jgi:hypothetical protein
MAWTGSSATSAMASFKPDVLDKFDADKWADNYADMLGVSPELIVPDDQVGAVSRCGKHHRHDGRDRAGKHYGAGRDHGAEWLAARHRAL